MPASSPAISAYSDRPRRKTLANSPNRRREALRVAVWLVFVGGASVVTPYLLMSV